eukprot:1334306-Prorocentrum_lima.AAC.1
MKGNPIRSKVSSPVACPPSFAPQQQKLLSAATMAQVWFNPAVTCSTAPKPAGVAVWFWPSSSSPQHTR